ncbi:putative membrane protein [Mucilaginibacter sp. UYNi724]
MKPLIVLLAVFGVSSLATFIAGHPPDYYFCGRLAMGVMLIFAATAHFKFTSGMMLMVPTFIPYKKAVVHITGYIEILAAIGMLVKNVREPVAWFVIFFLVMLLPANIHAAKNEVNLEKPDACGNGLNYLWFRVPLQIFFIAWVYFFGVMH